MNKHYIILAIMGGIGDQIFQFSYANFLQKRFKCKVLLDTSYYNSKKNYNKFKFVLKNLSKKKKFKVITNFFFFDFKFISLLRFFENKIFSIIKLALYKFFFKFKIKNFIYQYWNSKKKNIYNINSYYFGYWHYFKNLKNLKKIIYKNLILVELKKNNIKKFKKNIKYNSVAVHVRGGDFRYVKSHNALSEKYYKKAIQYFAKNIKKPNFHIFTNDIDFAKQLLLKNLKNFDYIFIKDHKFTDIEEFSLFSKYKHAVIANSTFSLMSSFLSYERIYSLAPKNWLGGKTLSKNKKYNKLKFI